MTNAINLQELEHELTRTRAMFEQWSSNVLSTAQGCKAAHIANMKASKGELSELAERYERAEKQATQVRQQMAQDRQHQQELQEKADALVAEQQVLLKQLQQLQQEVQESSDVVRQLNEEVAQKQSRALLRLAKFEQLHNAYRDCLGLAIRSGKDELYLEFKHIDPQQPDRPFGFALQVDAEDRYSVTRCEPKIPNLRQLEQQLLGVKADLPGFVRSIRQCFQQLATSAAAHSIDTPSR